MTTEIATDDKIAALEAEYRALCEEFLKLRDYLLKSFVKGSPSYKECPNCGSLINSEEASKCYRWNQAECLICYGSMLSLLARKKLATLANKREDAYLAWQGLSKRKEPLYKDNFFEMRHISKTSKPLFEQEPKKKTAWQKVKGIFS